MVYGTFEQQQKLPHLPVPSLKHSLSMFLGSVKPLLSDEEFKNTEKLANDLKNGKGIELHNLLVQRAEKCQSLELQNRETPGSVPIDQPGHPDGSVFPDCHWLERWWETYAYLAGRDTLCCYLNVFNPLYGSQPLPALGSQGANGVDESYSLHRAAWTAAGFLDFQRLLNTGEYGLVPPEQAGKIVLCSAQYHRIFSTSRIAGESMDQMESNKQARHICVERKGHWYSFVPFGLSVNDIIQRLEWIKRDADEKGLVKDSHMVASLTAEDRDVWAKARVKLLQNPTCAKTLRTIETGIFNIILSAERPKNPSEVQNISQHGNGKHMWFDKSLTLMQFDNGVMGTNLEHTSADAVVPARMIMYASEFATENAKLGIAHPHKMYQGATGIPISKLGADEPITGATSWGAFPKPGPTQVLTWDLDETDKQNVINAIESAKRVIADNNLTVLTFDDFGAKSIAKKTGVPTDSFMQMCLALAYARDQRSRSGQIVPPTYETAMTRGFFHGRTETIRSQSMESKSMVEKFDDPSVPDAEKAELFRKAAGYHRNYLKQCMIGNGCDRHLMGLKLIAMENGQEMHPFFTSKAYVESTNFQLSTSQLPWLAEDYPGFGAPGPDAYGVCYRFSVTDKIRATVSSRHSCKHKDANRFRDTIAQTLRDVMKVTSENKPTTTPKSKL